jgi:hypothetical protein
MPKLLLRQAGLLVTMEGLAEARSCCSIGWTTSANSTVPWWCQPRGVDVSVANVEMVLQDGYLLTLDLGSATERQNQISRQLLPRE